MSENFELGFGVKRDFFGWEKALLLISSTRAMWVLCIQANFVGIRWMKVLEQTLYTHVHCRVLKTVILPSSLRTVGTIAFLNTALANVTVPATTAATLGPQAFESPLGLKHDPRRGGWAESPLPPERCNIPQPPRSLPGPYTTMR